MKKAVFSAFILVLLLMSGTTLAQTYRADQITLENGSVLRGDILNEDDDKVSIQLHGGSIFVIDKSEVVSISRDISFGQDLVKEQGYRNYTGFDVLNGDNSGSIRFTMVNGYQFNRYISLGLGLGYTSYDGPLNTIPVFLDLRYRPLKSNVSPIVFTKLGYSFTQDDSEEQGNEIVNHDGGRIFSIGTGFQFDTKAGYGWGFNIGYNIEDVSFNQRGWNNQTIRNEISYRRMTIGFNLVF